MKKELAYVLYCESTKRYYSHEHFDGSIHIGNARFYVTETAAENARKNIEDVYKCYQKQVSIQDVQCKFQVTPLEVKHI